ncbi:MAG: gliding motility protein GldB [Prevotella sp.]|nr:gliding motility protein GldB [Prevotella sp.]
MRRTILIFIALATLVWGCKWNSHSVKKEQSPTAIAIDRFDRIESLYLTMGDFAALQQMNTDYPMETRMLIEDVLQLGRVDDPDMKVKFLIFFQDSTLQTLIHDVGLQYESTDDLNRELSQAFSRLQTMIPGLDVPHIYSQIGSLDQSITVGSGILGISLDKYLGSDYELYKHYGYSDRQRQMMTRQYIVPDCLSFYLLSCFPSPPDSTLTRQQRDVHMGRIQLVVNRALDRRIFSSSHVAQAETWLAAHPNTSIREFLSTAEK